MVLPELGRKEGREHSGDGAGGDVTFAIDERAEARMEQYLAEHAPDPATAPREGRDGNRRAGDGAAALQGERGLAVGAAPTGARLALVHRPVCD